ncbi:hypothetical protein GGX14DRAFT_378236 [Mycena pura]|uniref:Uncharacterized protein n=1 Tax=Mycena pura TaxID=153505 RepID=A0AAD6UTE9_9AGAR|nr:hypothetical protein GGX14DRAFT_378236 [Mycena pura]
MFFTTSSSLLAVLLAIQVNAQSLIAWSGNACDGSEGADVVCNGTCIDFAGRHSYEVLGSSATVSFFVNSGCTGQKFTFGPDPPGECVNVNTGTSINSFTCI